MIPIATPACEWIVCERTTRFSAALRVALARGAWGGQPLPRLVEVRTLGELAMRLDARPDSLAAIEVGRDALADVLLWLAGARRKYPRARFAALLDDSLASREVDAAIVQHRGTAGRAERLGEQPSKLVGVALREAGAAEIVSSPRKLTGLLELGQRHAAAASACRRQIDSELPLAARAWASLPWQET